MDKKELLYLLALQSVPGIGPVNAKKLIQKTGSARTLFEEGEEIFKDQKGVNSSFLKGLKDPLILKKAAAEIEFITSFKIEPISGDQTGYPERLRHCQDGPLLIFKKGKFELNGRKVISIVGSREMTSYGAGFLKEFIGAIKKYNPVIVSGLAYGIDITAHREALKNGLDTIGILAHGLDRIYPKTHQKEAMEMIESGGLITEFWSGSRPERVNFIKRNRIIAGISEATIVIESGSKGGSLITADFALSYDRDVFALPGRVHDRMSEGCNGIIKSNKAALLTSVKDLEYLLNWKEELQLKKAVQPQLFYDLSRLEQLVYDYLTDRNRQQLDTLALECELSVSVAASILMQLELKGLVKSLPGKAYQRTN